MIEVTGPWSIETVNSKKGPIQTLVNNLGKPIWPVGIGRLNRQKMDQHDESVRWWNRWTKQSEHIETLATLSKRAGFEFGSDLSENVFNTEIPCFFQPTAAEHSARGRYMSKEQHIREYPGQPYDDVEGRGRIPVNVAALSAEIVETIRKYPNIVAINLTEFLWGSRVWKLPFSNVMREMLTIVQTAKQIAPEYMVIWSHALTATSPSNNYWNDENLISAFDEFLSAGGDLITVNWYPSATTFNLKGLLRSHPRIRWFLDHPTGLSEFGVLVPSEFRSAVEGSPNGRRSLDRENVGAVRPDSEYVYPIVQSWDEKIAHFYNYLQSSAKNPRCLLASPYSAEDHDRMQWGYVFNPYTWEPYPSEEISSAIFAAKLLRSELLGIDFLE